MALARVYDVTSNSTTGITIGSTTPGTEFPILWGVSNTSEFNISAVRVGVYSGTSASYPSNGTITWRLRRVGQAATFTTGLQATATAVSIGQSTTAAASSWYYSTLANATGTFSVMTASPLWEQTIPCTAGANWGEWFTPGFEINVGPGQATLALTYLYGNGTSATVDLTAGLVISE